jgi:hypothetical protein
MIAALVLGLAVAAPAQAPSLVALRSIERGQWLLKSRDAPASVRSICLADPTILIQLHHPGAACSRFIISDLPGAATVHYTCPGNGHGRTTLSVETPRLIQVATTGVNGNGPFDEDYEARRTGDCAVSASTAAAH